jgi:hypothetical protein
MITERPFVATERAFDPGLLSISHLLLPGLSPDFSNSFEVPISLRPGP